MRILVADDHELFRDGLRLVLETLTPNVVVGMAGTYDETLNLVVDEPRPDLVLLDLVMPGMPWTDGLRALAARAPGIPVVVLSASENYRLVMESLRLGARGFIPKTSSSKVMLSALHLVLSGGTYLPPSVLAGHAGPVSDPASLTVDPIQAATVSLTTGGGSLAEPIAAPSAEQVTHLTPRQREVLTLLGHGKSNKEIARVLDLSEGTVKLHVTAILKALGVSNRTGAVVAASRLGLTTLNA